MKRRETVSWIELIFGIVLAVVGAYTLFNPHMAMRSVTMLYSIIAIASGIADAVFYARLDRRTGFAPSTLIISAVLNILLGIVLLLNLNLGTWVFAILFPLWFILHCIGRIANADIVRVVAGKASYWTMLIVNILGILIGVALLVHPQVSSVVFGYLLGGYLLVTGIVNVVVALSRWGGD